MSFPVYDFTSPWDATKREAEFDSPAVSMSSVLVGRGLLLQIENASSATRAANRMQSATRDQFVK